MNAEKVDFLKTRFPALLKEIPTDTHPLWGKMSLQQMVEHFADSVRVASGRVPGISIHTPHENLQKMQEFLMSDKPFRENTMNPLMPEVPAPVRNKSINDAIAELKKELQHFFDAFSVNEHLTTINPFFGNLNFKMNVQLLYKHAIHHLRQFGVNVTSKSH